MEIDKSSILFVMFNGFQLFLFHTNYFFTCREDGM